MPSPDSAFTLWLSSRQQPGLRGRQFLSTRAAEPYRTVWLAWCRWVAGVLPDASPHAYLVANSALVDRFLTEGVSPVAGRSGPVKPQTLLRYRRILSAVYAHLVTSGQLATSPASLNPRAAGLGRASAAPESLAVAADAHWAALIGALDLLHTQDSGWVAVRDGALFELLLNCGLRSNELAALRVDALSDALDAPGEMVLVLRGGQRLAQARELRVGGKASERLRRWLQVRAEVLDRRSAQSALLFFTNRLAPVNRDGVRLSVQSWFDLAAGLAEPGVGADLRELAHQGPQVVRNSWLVRRLRAGDPLDQVLHDAGLKRGQHDLRRLARHLPAGVSAVGGSPRAKRSQRLAPPSPHTDPLALD